MTVTAAGPAEAATRAETELLVEGMTCGACATRVERKLRKLGDVQASVNFATGRATVTHPDTLGVDALVAVVEDAGYTAREPEPVTRDDPAEAAHERHLAALRQRLAALGLTAHRGGDVGRFVSSLRMVYRDVPTLRCRWSQPFEEPVR
jgi:P-type Cu+ transporter